MQKLNSFITVFIIAIVATGVFLVFYFKAFFALSFHDELYNSGEFDPFFDVILNPQLIISGIVMGIANIAYRALAIYYVSKTPSINQGEKIMWILGFVCFGFVTAIVFILIARNRRLLEG